MQRAARYGTPMRALHAACFGLALVTSACALPGRTASPTPTDAPPPPPTPTAVARVVARVVPTATSPARPAPVRPPTVTRAPTPVPVITAQAEKPAPALDGVLDGLLPDLGSAYSVVLEDLVSGARTTVNADQSLPAASLYKLGVAWAIMRRVDAGTLREDEQLTIEDDDAIEAEPYGGFGPGDTPTIRDALQGMLSVSSNSAAHALLRILGRDSLAQEMDRIGLHQTRVPDDGQAVTSADDIALLLRLIATSPDLSQSSRAAIAQGMSSIAPPDALRDTLPNSVGVYDKTGNLDDASNVGALLETPRATAILVVIDTGVHPGEARAIIARAGQIAYNSLLEPPPSEE